MILDPGYKLTLRPMQYPQFFEMYKAALKNNWTVSEVNFSVDVNDLQTKMSAADRHLIQRLVAFFATGDTIVGNNLVINLYGMINSPEARMYLGRQLFEEMLHVEFYLTLLDTYVPDAEERAAAFKAVENIESIAAKARFCEKWIYVGSFVGFRQSDHNDEYPINPVEAQTRQLKNLIAFAACIEGIFFFAAFAYVFFLRSRGLLPGLAAGTNWTMRDESGHIGFALEVVNVIRREAPELFNAKLEADVRAMIVEAVECETQFARDLLSQGVMGLSVNQMRGYLEFIADLRMRQLGYANIYNTKNPLAFMEQQDLQELTNFFERRPTAYAVGVEGKVDFEADF